MCMWYSAVHYGGLSVVEQCVCVLCVLWEQVGGIKEKVLAAHRAGLTRIILPRRNHKDLHEVPDNIKVSVRIQGKVKVSVRTMGKVKVSARIQSKVKVSVRTKGNVKASVKIQGTVKVSVRTMGKVKVSVRI